MLLEFIDFSEQIKHLRDNLHMDLYSLLRLSNELQIRTDKSTIITGDCKQKPLSFYNERACEILHIWSTYHKALSNSLENVDIRNNDSLLQFQKITELPVRFSNLLNDYLYFSHFLIKTI